MLCQQKHFVFFWLLCYYTADIQQEDKVPQRGVSINLTDGSEDHLCAVITASQGPASTNHISAQISTSTWTPDAFGASNETSVFRLLSVQKFRLCHYLLTFRTWMSSVDLQQQSELCVRNRAKFKLSSITDNLWVMWKAFLAVIAQACSVFRWLLRSV